MFVQVEAQLSSDDLGSDLSGAQSLLKKLQMSESDIAAHKVSVEYRGIF